MIDLINVYSHNNDEDYEDHVTFLYDLLAERDATTNISHNKMPSFEEHRKFVNSCPYKAWYILVDVGGEPAGSVYLTHKNEIGIFIKKSRQHRGLGKWAVERLMSMYPDTEFLANINPNNADSIKLFKGLGFAPLQVTFRRARLPF